MQVHIFWDAQTKFCPKDNEDGQRRAFNPHWPQANGQMLQKQGFVLCGMCNMAGSNWLGLHKCLTPFNTRLHNHFIKTTAWVGGSDEERCWKGRGCYFDIT